MDMLQIHLLGTPSLNWNLSLLAIERRQVRALVYRLAADMEPVSREHLCWLFWPDVAQTEAHRNLSHLLTHLRHALPLEEMLYCADDAILLQPQFVWSDSANFLRLVGIRQEPLTISDAEKAVALYRGPFLDAFALDSSSEYEAWVTIQRAMLEKLYLSALLLLADNEIDNHHYPLAISYLQRSLNVDPFDETLHRRLMEIYVASGNRVAAVREFDNYSDYLRREMEMEPLPETQAIIRNLCSQNRQSEVL